MSDDRKLLVLLAIVTSGVLVAVSWNRGTSTPRREWLHRGLMTVCAGFGLWAFTLFGQFHDHGAFGHQDFHAHDGYHYYFGSKYLKEWGYDGMYFATVAALEEIGRDEPAKAIEFNRIRDLDGSANFLYRPEFTPRLDAARARFTPARWAEFKRELSFLRSITMSTKWWHGVMLDNGFNPPPSYAALTSVVANAIPFTTSTWKWLGTFDLLLMAGGVAAIGWAFGVVPALFALVIMGNTPITTFNWTGGSFFRQLWLFFLMVGLSCLAKQKWRVAGASLGACTACVFFPVFFLVGATVPLAYGALRSKERTPFVQLALGAAGAMALMLGLSLLVYHVDPWRQWWHRIVAHDLTFFDNHVGLEKVMTFAREVGNQSFGASDSAYPDWNRALVSRAHNARILDRLLALVLSGGLVAACLRARPAESCVVVGSGLLLIWTMPAGYYTIFAGAFAAVMLANRSPWGNARFAVVATALVASVAMRRVEHDLIRQVFFVSLGWLACLVLIAVMNWLEAPPQLGRASAEVPTPKQRQRTVAGALAVAAVLGLTCIAIRNRVRTASFFPAQIVQSARVADALDFGSVEDEEAHHLALSGDKRVQRDLMDTYGNLIQDDCRVLHKGDKVAFDLAAVPAGGTLVVRTDGFYRGELLTTVNDQVLPPVHIEPHKSLFTYLQIPLPAGLSGKLHVEQETTSTDVGLFSLGLLTD